MQRRFHQALLLKGVTSVYTVNHASGWISFKVGNPSYLIRTPLPEHRLKSHKEANNDIFLLMTRVRLN